MASREVAAREAGGPAVSGCMARCASRTRSSSTRSRRNRDCRRARRRRRYRARRCLCIGVCRCCRTANRDAWSLVRGARALLDAIAAARAVEADAVLRRSRWRAPDSSTAPLPITRRPTSGLPTTDARVILDAGHVVSQRDAVELISDGRSPRDLRRRSLHMLAVEHNAMRVPFAAATSWRVAPETTLPAISMPARRFDCQDTVLFVFNEPARLPRGTRPPAMQRVLVFDSPESFVDLRLCDPALPRRPRCRSCRGSRSSR